MLGNAPLATRPIAALADGESLAVELPYADALEEPAVELVWVVEVDVLQEEAA